MAFLALQDIRKSYYLGKEEFPVLKGIDLAFERGEFVSILGESGGGKSTLMNILGGLDHNFTGDVIVNGQSLKGAKEKDFDQYRRQTIGFIFQSFNLISHLTVLENVLISLKMTTLSSKEQEKRALELLDQVGLSEHVKKHPNQLSGGQKQRVAIARALASDPEVIIADEPTGALDAQNTQEVLEILDGIAKSGKLVIAVTHSQAVADFGTRIVHLADGKIDGDTTNREKYTTEETAKLIPSRPLSYFANVRMAWEHVRYNIKRNLLIIFGGSIGIFAVILFLGLGNGIKGYMNQQITSLVNPKTITLNKPIPTGAAAAKTNPSHYELTNADLQKVQKVKHIDEANLAYLLSNASLQLGNGKKAATQIMTWNATLKDQKIVAGHQASGNQILLSKADAQAIQKNYKTLVGKTLNLRFVDPVAAAKAQLASAQFGGQTPPGMAAPRTIEVTIKVAGILDGGASSMSLANMKQIFANNKITFKANFLAVDVDSLNDVKQVSKDLKALKGSDGKALYEVRSVGSILDTINTYISLAANILAAIAGISLLVSAIMIIVVLYISVSERTKEIGILRALGGRKKDISRLFTAEAFFIGAFSAILGLVFAYIMQTVINLGVHSLINYPIVNFSLGNVIFAMIISIVISLLAAAAPSHVAARLDPIQSLAAGD